MLSCEAPVTVKPSRLLLPAVIEAGVATNGPMTGALFDGVTVTTAEAETEASAWATARTWKAAEVETEGAV